MWHSRPALARAAVAMSAALAQPLLTGVTHKKRIELLDNAKAVLVCCVVLYHTAVVYTSADRPEVSMPLSL